MRRGTILVTGAIGLLHHEIVRKLADAGVDAVVIPDGVQIVDHVEGSPNFEDALRTMSERSGPVPVEPFKVRAEHHDERRGDPQRDVAALRREMLARERSNRHMLKKGRGRR